MKKYAMKTITLILTLAVLLSVVSTVVYATDNQSDDYYRISTAEQLNEVRNNLGGKYILCANIDLSGIEWDPIGTYNNPFTGIFDGNGYTVSNVTIDKHFENSVSDVGFFGCTNGAIIKNLGIETAEYEVTTSDFNSQKFSNVGGIAGSVYNTSIECCYFKGSISNCAGTYVFARSGGITACAIDNSSIMNCYSHSNVYAKAVSMNAMAGGIVAWLDSTDVSNCYFYGSVVSEFVEGVCYSGGINASGNETGTVKNCVSLLERLEANAPSIAVDTIGNFSTQTNNKTLDYDSTGAFQRATYENLGWDFANVWEIGSSYPKLIIHSKSYIYGREFDRNIDYYVANCRSSEYSPTLANMLAALSAAAYDETKIANAYKSLGFDNYIGPLEYTTTNPYRCGYNIGIKDSEYNDDKICLITVRGSKTVSDWIGNFDIFTFYDEKHLGFVLPAENIYDRIQSELSESLTSNNIKYVITGHSRGAAVANLLAVELMEEGVNPDNIYNYNYACPDVACKENFTYYENIFNLCNRKDEVPYVPGPLSIFTNDSVWGKFGKTYWFTKQPPTKTEPFSGHSMDLYLEFFNEKLEISDWPYSETDKVRDSVYSTFGWLVKVFCPVDVIITDEEGNNVASVINGEVNYYDSDFGQVIISTDGDKKFIYINDENSYNINLIGVDTGSMTYTLEKCNLSTGEIPESKTFNDVVLEEGKTMYCTVNENTEIHDVPLFVVEEKDGEMIYTHTIATDGTEIPIKTNPSMDKDDSNESMPSDTLGENNDASIFDMLKNIPKETIIIIGASVAGVILLVVICAIVKKKRS